MNIDDSQFRHETIVVEVIEMVRKNKPLLELIADRKRRSLSTVGLRMEEAEMLAELLTRLGVASLKDAVEVAQKDLAAKRKIAEQIEKIKQSANYHDAQFRLNKSMYSQGIADGLYDALAILAPEFPTEHGTDAAPTGVE